MQNIIFFNYTKSAEVTFLPFFISKNVTEYIIYASPFPTLNGAMVRG